eukprot:12797203-Prorocentrum_lima.AAC.1
MLDMQQTTASPSAAVLVNERQTRRPPCSSHSATAGFGRSLAMEHGQGHLVVTKSRPSTWQSRGHLLGRQR